MAARSLAIAATVAALLFAVAAPAPSDTLTVESFTGAAVADPSAWVAGGTGGANATWPGMACLTAGTNTSQTPIPGCADPAIDSVGSGVLRLTPADFGRAGFALHNAALTTAGGLDITFKESEWQPAGPGGADGIGFFLVDGTTNLTAPGASGGNLGYSPGNFGSNGVANALVGIGIDAWGNFSSPGATANSGSGCDAASGPGSRGPGQTPNRVVIRGPGNGQVGYCFLASSGDVGVLSGGSRAAATHTVRVVFDPDTVASRNVTVYLDGTQVVQTPAPPELLAATTFKFGFAAATGAAINNNEVWDLTIESVNPVAPTTTTTTTTAAPPVTTQPTFTG